WETGTPNFEGINALGKTIDYIQEIGTRFGREYTHLFPYDGRKQELKMGMEAIRQYEKLLISRLLDVLEATNGVQMYGITDRNRLDERCPTVVFTHDQFTPHQIAEHLAKHHIYVWDGNYYAVEIMNRLGHSEHGMVRVGLAHYNTLAEIDHFGEVLRQLVDESALSVPQKRMRQIYQPPLYSLSPKETKEIWQMMSWQLFEMRRVLSSVIGYASATQLIFDKQELQYLPEFLRKINVYARETRRIEPIMQKLVLLGNGSFRLFGLKQFGLGTLVQSVQSRLQSEYSDKVIQYRLNFDLDTAQQEQIFGSEGQLETMIINLISEILDTNQQANITLDCGYTNEYVWYIHIIDTTENTKP
ncbi:MAG: aminotransferase class V-fold PLP-dependent enzyme, partial [Anaerolineae bacterium]|nr:aminotransferase class V-fold PLP-dependent enzyme [Anaerolineae bacterium]